MCVCGLCGGGGGVWLGVCVCVCVCVWGVICTCAFESLIYQYIYSLKNL